MNHNNAFKNVRNAVDHELQLLRDENRMLQEKLRREREERQKMEGELFWERNKLVLECKICYMQPDSWMTLLCGHLFCNSCAGNLDTSKTCPILSQGMWDATHLQGKACMSCYRPSSRTLSPLLINQIPSIPHGLSIL